MKKILLVDDRPDIIKLISLRLKVSGYEAIGASSGRECLEKAKQQTPDLILLDVNMPEMNGCETLEKLKQDNQTKSIPVIMLTADSQADNVKKAAESGAVDYIVKPFETAVMLEKIKKALS